MRSQVMSPLFQNSFNHTKLHPAGTAFHSQCKPLGVRLLPCTELAQETSQNYFLGPLNTYENITQKDPEN